MSYLYVLIFVVKAALFKAYAPFVMMVTQSIITFVQLVLRVAYLARLAKIYVIQICANQVMCSMLPINLVFNARMAVSDVLLLTSAIV